MVAKKETSFFTDLLAQRNSLPGDSSFLRTFGEVAAEKLPELPVPTNKDEEWRFTNISPLLRSTFVPYFEASGHVTYDQISDYEISEAEGARLVFVNGIYNEELSSVSNLPEGVVLVPIADAGENDLQLIRKELGNHMRIEKDPFLYLNASFLQNGIYLRVLADTKIEQPVHFQFISTDTEEPFFAVPRCLIIGERFSKFTIIEDYVGLGKATYFNAPVVEIKLDEGAHLLHTRVQRESPEAFHVSRVGATLTEHSDYESYSVHIGSKISRNDVYSVLAGREINCTLDGLVMIHNDQLSDTHTLMDHQQPYCTSHQLHKTLVDDKSHSVFNGKIYVRPGAQKTDSFQENRNLLLSSEGTVDTKPQLEIFADDVKCSHGATVGQFEADELFYLRSRGLSDETARQLLAYGFALDIIERIPVTSLQRQLSSAVSKFSNRNEEIQNLV